MSKKDVVMKAKELLKEDILKTIAFLKLVKQKDMNRFMREFSHTGSEDDECRVAFDEIVHACFPLVIKDGRHKVEEMPEYPQIKKFMEGM